MEAAGHQTAIHHLGCGPAKRFISIILQSPVVVPHRGVRVANERQQRYRENVCVGLAHAVDILVSEELYFPPTPVYTS
jgi:hypothetical protein